MNDGKISPWDAKFGFFWYNDEEIFKFTEDDFDEKSKAEEMGFEYIHIPVDGYDDYHPGKLEAVSEKFTCGQSVNVYPRRGIASVTRDAVKLRATLCQSTPMIIIPLKSGWKYCCACVGYSNNVSLSSS